jgi:hypothetical protein
VPKGRRDLLHHQPVRIGDPRHWLGDHRQNEQPLMQRAIVLDTGTP